METLGNFPIRPFLDQAQNEQLALGVGEVFERAQDSGRKRQAVVDGLEIGLHNGDREAQALPSAILDSSLA